MEKMERELGAQEFSRTLLEKSAAWKEEQNRLHSQTAELPPGDVSKETFDHPDIKSIIAEITDHYRETGEIK